MIVLKKDQKTDKLTQGIVKDILTKSPTHPHGIKVRLETGEVGRVKKYWIEFILVHESRANVAFTK
ncbi:MAG: YwbE family protein [Desulfosalsimonadaceae bacterium]|nr:MAG: YwbE family protein [Desulfobacteraceae bacterium]